jgi:hypothetical protein
MGVCETICKFEAVFFISHRDGRKFFYIYETKISYQQLQQEKKPKEEVSPDLHYFHTKLNRIIYKNVQNI